MVALSTRLVCTGGHVPVTECRGMALNGLFCADVLRPLNLVPLTDFTYKYHIAIYSPALLSTAIRIFYSRHGPITV